MTSRARRSGGLGRIVSYPPPNPGVLAAAVGWISLGISVPLTLAPGPSAAFLGWEGHPRLASAVGVADLIVGPALLLGRKRARWMLARAALNVIIVGIYARVLMNGRHQPARAVGGVVGMSILTFTDYSLARRLRTAEARPPDAE